MLMSLEKQFLFVHVTKAAGSSIRTVLEPYCVNPRDYFINRALEAVGRRVNRFGPFPRHRFRLHDTAETARRSLPRDVFERFFKFAFVRNPWDRMVSMYAYLLARPDHHRHRLVVSLGGFEEYLRMELNRGYPTQMASLADRQGRLLVDFVGRFERLEEDFATICQKLGIAGRLGHRNGSVHAPYQEMYTPVTRELVARYFAPDIEQFGYEFSAAQPQSLPQVRRAA